MTNPWDEAKHERNLKDHLIAFEAFYGFDWKTALILEDDRKDYGEIRYIAFGLIGRRLHVLVFTIRNRECRVISLRKANKKERNFYAALP